MKSRWMLPMFALTAFLAVPVIGIADDNDAKEEKKCCSKERGECCSKDKESRCSGETGVCCSKLADIKCPISGHDIDKEVAVDYAGGKVFLCCDHCIEALKKDNGKDGEKKFVAKANYQLVATGQAKQKCCPVSGKPVKEGAEIKVGANEVEIGFCCKGCTKGAKSKSEEDRLTMIFGEKAFAKAFMVGDDNQEKEKNADHKKDAA